MLLENIKSGLMKFKAVNILKEFEDSKTPKQLIQENKASKNTVYRYWKRYQMYNELKEKLWNMIVESV
jgi:hypothetical protein